MVIMRGCPYSFFDSFSGKRTFSEKEGLCKQGM